MMCWFLSVQKIRTIDLDGKTIKLQIVSSVFHSCVVWCFLLRSRRDCIEQQEGRHGLVIGSVRQKGLRPCSSSCRRRFVLLCRRALRRL
jgi:hypothetical protein